MTYSIWLDADNTPTLVQGVNPPKLYEEGEDSRGQRMVKLFDVPDWATANNVLQQYCDSTRKDAAASG